MFKNDCTSVADEKRTGRPVTANTPNVVSQVNLVVLLKSTSYEFQR